MLDTYFQLVGSVLAISAAFLLLERFIPAEKSQPVRSWLFNLAYVPFILAFILIVTALLGPAFASLLELSGGGLLPSFVGPDSGVAAQMLFALAYAFVWDLSQYAMHRLQHAVPALWETHRFHHDETALNAAAQARVHPTSYLLAMAFHMPVIVLFGPQVPHFIATFLMFRLWGFVNHANLRLGFGPLTLLLSGPQWHRIHHSALGAHRDRNFATFFPIIDRLFGTYYRPRPGEYPPTGLDGETMRPLRSATLGPFATWYFMLRSRLGRTAG